MPRIQFANIPEQLAAGWRQYGAQSQADQRKGPPMFARINHLAICTTQYAMNARFYQALFGMKAANVQRPARSHLPSASSGATAPFSSITA